MANEVVKDAHTVPSALRNSKSEPRRGAVPSPGVKVADMIVVLSHIEELQAKNKVVLYRRLGNKILLMDTLLKVYYEKKETDMLEAEVKR